MATNTNNDDDFNLNLDDSDNESKGGMAGIKEKLSLKLVLILAGVLLVIIICVVGFILFSGGGASETELSDEPAVKEKGPGFESFVAFDDVVRLEETELILSDMGGEKTLTVGISLKIDQQELRDELFREDLRVKNTILTLLKTKTLGELSGVEGKILLRHEITKLLNDFLLDGHIVNLYFYKFLIM